MSTENLTIFIAKTPNEVLETSNKKRALNFARLGVIVTKKIDKRAVIRNLIKRRIREAFKNIDKNSIREGYDYQIIAKSSILEVNFDEILSNVKNCIM